MSRFYVSPEVKILKHYEAVSYFCASGRGRPINLEVDVSWDCSVGCPHCDFSFTHNKASKMTLESAKILLERCLEVGVKAITWTGGGEPLENPNFKEIVTMFAAKGLSQGLYTSGAIDNKELAATLNDCLEWVFISQYPPYYLLQQKSKATLGRGFLVSRQTDNAFLLEAVTRAAAYPFDFIFIRPTVYDPFWKVAESGRNPEIWIPQKEDLLRQLEEIPKVVVSWGSFLSLKNWKRDYTKCYATDFVPCVGPDLEVWYCPNKRLFSSIGNLREASFDALWAKKEQPVVDFSGCRPLCRNHKLNQTLFMLKEEALRHVNFV